MVESEIRTCGASCGYYTDILGTSATCCYAGQSNVIEGERCKYGLLKLEQVAMLELKNLSPEIPKKIQFDRRPKHLF